MKVLDELQKSELVIARILNLLMDWGIQDCELSYEELELEESYKNFFLPCIDWLKAEGVIRTGEIDVFLDGKATVYNPSLTSIGFKLLESQLNIGGGTEKMSETVRTVSNERRSYSQVGDFVGGLLGGFTKSIGS